LGQHIPTLLSAYFC